MPLLPLLPGQASAPDAAEAAGLAPGSLQDPRLAQAQARSKSSPDLPAAAAALAADFAASGKFSTAVAGEIALGAAGQKPGLPQPTAALATDLAHAGKSTRGGEIAPGAAARKSGLTPIAAAASELAASAKFSTNAEGEIRREVAFAASLLERHKAAPAPAPAAAAHVGAAAPAQAAQASVAAIEARVGAQGWDQGLGDKLVWMAGQKHQVAELHLNPPDLGPLKITLTLNHEQASAQFVSAHAQVREAIEAAMPRLREMLADSGITLGDTSVGTDAFHEQAQPQQQPRAYAGAPAATTADSGAVARGEQLLRRAHGLVDTFA
jgi:flagellar hook-length control protein FliK